MERVALSRSGGWKPLAVGLLAGLAASLLVLWLAAVGSEFMGADDSAGEVIAEISPGTEPWFTPIWSPDEETERALFVLQAAAGGGVMGYLLARRRAAS